MIVQINDIGRKCEKKKSNLPWSLTMVTKFKMAESKKRKSAAKISRKSNQI